jgi:hypothetical protein
MRPCVWSLVLILGSAGPVAAAPILIEPDDFVANPDMTNPAPGVRLSTALSDNSPVPLFVVQSVDEPLNLASTGDRVFSHVGIPFMSDERRLRIDFTAGLGSSVGIDYISSGFTFGEVGRLEVYGASGLLLESVASPNPPDTALPRGTIVPLTITRPTADISFAVAYSQGGFGRFDALQVETADSAVVPEPSAAVLGLIGLAASGLGSRLRRRPTPRG